MALLEIKNLNFTYPEAAQPALSDINLENTARRVCSYMRCIRLRQEHAFAAV